MRKFGFTLLLGLTLSLTAGAAFGQQKSERCEDGARSPRNWELFGRDYVYFDYVLCPADLKPPRPLVRVWITTRGEGYAVERWAPARERADVVSVFHGKKKAYTLYRDLDAVPLEMLKAERRPLIPAELSSQPFMLQDVQLVPLVNFTPESAERARKIFESADAIIQTAQKKTPLLYASTRIGALVEALEQPLKSDGQ
jgi:hypothetical protein